MKLSVYPRRTRSRHGGVVDRRLSAAALLVERVNHCYYNNRGWHHGSYHTGIGMTDVVLPCHRRRSDSPRTAAADAAL